MVKRIAHNELCVFTPAAYLEAKALRLANLMDASTLGQDNACFHNYPSAP